MNPKQMVTALVTGPSTTAGPPSPPSSVPDIPLDSHDSEIDVADTIASLPAPSGEESSKAPSLLSKVPIYVEKLKRGMELLAKNAERFVEGTPFQVPLAILNVCIEVAHTVSDNETALKSLFEQTSSQLELLNSALIKADSEHAMARIGRISRILVLEMNSITDLRNRRLGTKVLLSDADKQTITDAMSRINRYLDDFQIDVILSIERNTNEMKRQLNLIQFENWPRSRHATYLADTDSSTTLSKRHACTPNTRVNILQQIKQWVENRSPDTPPVFWLNGHAGAGKSTIAFSISQDYDGRLLAASFFCSRQFEDTRKRKFIIPTIAHQLGHHLTAFYDALASVDSSEACDEPDKQILELFVTPWQRCLEREDIRNYSRAHIPKHGTLNSNNAYSDQTVHIDWNAQCLAQKGHLPVWEALYYHVISISCMASCLLPPSP
ncbi:hypothetical protein K438DRAFT_1867463 [Mycena galopus ATCC 62051]|nr:hypothetical protein K438DRAFT_1867463 [Mycena galopus ATCC 62051]